MRAEWIKILCGIIIAFLCITGYSSFLSGPGAGNIVINEFKTGSSYSVTIPVGGGSNNKSIIQLPTDANVVDASMRVTGSSNGGEFPSHIEMDVGEDGLIEWEFDEIGGGSWGWLNSFWNGVNNTPFNMGQVKYNLTHGFRLPKGVDVEKATMDVWAEEQDYKETVIELNLPGGGLFGPWDDVHDYDPMIIVFNNRLLVFFRTHSDVISNGTDGDLVVNWTDNGVDWVDLNEVTKVPDGTWPWDNTRAHWWGMDMRPTLAEYNNRLYIAWEGNSTKAGPYPPDVIVDPDDTRGITTGYDKDIMITSSSDGITWGPPMGNYIEITNPENEDGVNRNGYNEQNGNPQDWLPQLAVFNNRLYCLWVTNNTHSPADSYGGSDIMVTWSTSPDNETTGWSNPIVNLTAGDMWNGSDFNPKLVVYDNKLIAMWMTNDTTRGNGSDYDIMMRYTEDGNTWSSTTYQVSSKGENDWTEEKIEGTEDLEFWDMTPDPIVFNDTLGIVWETENWRYSYNRTWNQPTDDQTDADIVIAWTKDVKDWALDPGTNIFEITPPANDWGDHYPDLTIVDPDGAGPQPERVYCVWNSNDQGVSIWDYDILYSYSTDGEKWKPQMFGSTHPDHGGGDYWSHMAAFKGALYISYWSFDDKDGPKQGMYADGDDADVLVRRILLSYIPVPNVSIDVRNDGTKEWGPGTLSNTPQEIDFKSALNNAIDAASTFHTDEFGNEYVDVVVNVSSPDVPCRIWLANINITYNKGGGDFYVDLQDFSEALNEYIRVHQDDEDASDGVLDIPIKLSSATGGKLVMSQVSIEYNRKPTIKVTSPGDTLVFAKETFTITWEANDHDDDATIKLYYDSNNKLGGETEINTSASPITEDTSPGYFEWDTSMLSIGSEYYVKAVIDDGIDTAYSYSKNKVRITRDNVPPSITILKPSASNAKTEFDYKIEWMDSDEDSNAWISLYYDDNTNPDDGKTLIIDTLRENDADNKYHWIIGDEVTREKNYYIYAEISDEENTTSDYSDGYIELVKPSLQKPINLDIKNNIDTTGTRLETHDILPELEWANSPLNPAPNATNLINYKYIVNVGTSSVTKSDLLYNWETSITSVKIANNLTYGEDYYFEVKVTDGRGHYSPAASATFYIVNHPPTAPTIVVTPANPNTKHTLKVDVQNASVDPDKDEIEYRYKWFKNDEEQKQYEGEKQVSADDTQKDDVWKVVVTPYDLVGGIPRAAGTSSQKSVIIGNAPPEPKIVAPNDGGKYTEGTAVKFLAEVFDPDPGDLEKIEYSWFSNIYGSLGNSNEVVKDDLSLGTHEITLNVTDGEDYATKTISINIKEPDKGPVDGTEGGLSTAATAAIGGTIIAIIIILIVVVLFLMRRGKKEEPMYPELDQTPVVEEPTGPTAEQLYGEDMPGIEETKPEMPPPGGEGATPPPQMPPPAGPPAEGGQPPQLGPGEGGAEAPKPAPEGTPPTEPKEGE